MPVAGAALTIGGVDVPPEVKLLVEDGVSFLGPLHVLVDIRDGDQEVVLVAEQDSGQDDDEAADGGVLKVGQLELARPELDPPANLGVGRRRLEPHRLPVGRLDVFKVVRVRLALGMNLLTKQRHGVPGRRKARRVRDSEEVPR